MKIALLGYGKMGKAIEKLALEAGHEIVLRISEDNSEDLTTEHLRKADVAIEFSSPEGAFPHIRLCLETGVPVVSGTTGWLGQMEEARAICRREGGAFLYASNFSIGVNIFFVLNQYLAELMNAQGVGYEVAIEEIHHTQKLDAPSGTALTLAETIIKGLDRKSGWTKEHTGNQEEVPVFSKRVGQVPGTHEVTYSSAIDSITIRHEAHSREGFARGALRAAEWLVGRSGVFGMRDMLGF